MATGHQQWWEGEALGLLQISSLAPLQNTSDPLCWYILGRVIFTLRNKHSIIKHQWTDGHIAHRWQHTTLLACRATLECQTSLKTCCIITLEEQYNLWGCLRLKWDPECVWPVWASHQCSGREKSHTYFSWHLHLEDQHSLIDVMYEELQIQTVWVNAAEVYWGSYMFRSTLLSISIKCWEVRWDCSSTNYDKLECSKD